MMYSTQKSNITEYFACPFFSSKPSKCGKTIYFAQTKSGVSLAFKELQFIKLIEENKSYSRKVYVLKLYIALPLRHWALYFKNDSNQIVNVITVYVMYEQKFTILPIYAKSLLYYMLLIFTGARNKRMVLVMLKACVVPSILRHITVCDYTKEALRSYFWDRLYASLKLS